MKTLEMTVRQARNLVNRVRIRYATNEGADLPRRDLVLQSCMSVLDRFEAMPDTVILPTEEVIELIINESLEAKFK